MQPRVDPAQALPGHGSSGEFRAQQGLIANETSQANSIFQATWAAKTSMRNEMLGAKRRIPITVASRDEQIQAE